MSRRIRTRIKRIFILFLMISMFFIPVSAQSEISIDNIDSNKIDEFINTKMKSEKIPGCSLAVVKDDRIIYLKGYGIDGKNKPVTEETPFILGSISKSFTGLAVMQLVDEGKIDLDAPVQKYLPWFNLADSELSKQITIKHLLSQTSGFSVYDGRKALQSDNTNIEQFVRNQQYLKLSKFPGEMFQYSNSNYIILGAVIQAVSGISYEQYIQENIFKPLEMKHSYTNKNDGLKNGLTNGYNSCFGFMLPINKPEHEASVPAGYLISCSEDMSHYLMAEMNSGEYKNNSIISREGMSNTHSNLGNSNVPYGAGWFISNSYINHFGDTENFHTDVRIYTNENLGIAMLFNSNDTISATLSNGEAYADIPSGVIDILHGKEPSVEKSTFDTSFIRTVINAAGVIIILLLFMVLVRAFKWKNKLKLSKLNILILVIFNLLIPLLIAFFVPDIFASSLQTPIRTFILFVPDFGVLIVLIPIVLFVAGIIKLTFFVPYLRYRKQVKEIQI
ncbi:MULTISPECIES: serine hydrolase domain-containing protein [unclassified Clostridium]|uniref:serine hydrolase domain-containing protein n=1 Tax=unclassified Clostridium TaxID=2614128 RepID=UPI000297836A|nr:MULTISPECIES: serine hydrolase domain-containing protein [unclassified Clostridium]EKQ57502.1 MAG: penicillin-binding protein, beta-lactamase class C [Clostridium sp. Maddingley MBC34-26]